MMNKVAIGNILLGGATPFVLFAGPCVIENEQLTREIALVLKEITIAIDVPFVFKASYDKANRTAVTSYRGVGIKNGLDILAKIRSDYNIKILTDVHRFEDIRAVCEICDVVQVPAFLCRQTDFIIEVAKYAKAINIKKGQFMAPADVKHIISKAKAGGNNNVIITERGTSFGYNNLVTDMRAFPIMRSFGFPVVFDATHSVQLPASCGDVSGGEREMVPYLCRAAIGAGVDGIFLETHPDPDKALCDGANSIKLNEMASLLKTLKGIDAITKRVINNGQ
ncbi:MAG: 3-deoxy-8-phosphooctulonate synthase [Deltaproteobacteria bacterium]